MESGTGLSKAVVWSGCAGRVGWMLSNTDSPASVRPTGVFAHSWIRPRLFSRAAADHAVLRAQGNPRLTERTAEEIVRGFGQRRRRRAMQAGVSFAKTLFAAGFLVKPVRDIHWPKRI